MSDTGGKRFIANLRGYLRDGQGTCHRRQAGDVGLLADVAGAQCAMAERRRKYAASVPGTVVRAAALRLAAREGSGAEYSAAALAEPGKYPQFGDEPKKSPGRAGAFLLLSFASVAKPGCSQAA